MKYLIPQAVRHHLYKVLRLPLHYVASLTQASTAAPEATVLSNSLDGTPTLARTGAGVYTVTLPDAFVADKTRAVIEVTPALRDQVQVERTSADVLTISTFDTEGEPDDDVLSGAVLKVEVYPAD